MSGLTWASTVKTARVHLTTRREESSHIEIIYTCYICSTITYTAEGNMKIKIVCHILLYSLTHKAESLFHQTFAPGISRGYLLGSGSSSCSIYSGAE